MGSAVVDGSVTLISLISKGSVFFKVSGRTLGCLAGSSYKGGIYDGLGSGLHGGQVLREYSRIFGEAFCEG